MPCGGKGGRQACSTDNGTHHAGNFGRGGSVNQGLFAVQDLGVGRCVLDEELEFQGQIFVGDNGDFGPVLRALLGEFVDLAVSCQGVNLEAVGVPCNDIERGYADAAGAAQDGERLHDGVPLE